MNIYVDEAGAFTPTNTKNYVCCISGLIIPTWQEQYLFDAFQRLRTSWGKSTNEVKGSKLDEDQVAKTIELLAKHQVLAEIFRIGQGGKTAFVFPMLKAKL